MPFIEQLQTGTTAYDISDANTYKSLSATQRTTLLSAGTYLGETVETGKIFETDAGTIEQFSKTVGPATWTWSNGLLASTQAYQRVAFGNGTFVAVGGEGAACSTDGSTWTKHAMSATSGWTHIVYGSDKFVAFGNSGLTSYSTDGITWTSAYTQYIQNPMSVTYGNGTFIAMSNSSTTHAEYSTDGITWRSSTMPHSAYWQATVYGNGKFLAFADNKVAQSTDGIAWTETTLTTTGDWVGSAYGNGVFVSVAYGSNKAMYSTDGTTWTETTLPASQNWIDVVYGDGVFVAVASYGNVFAYSFDGITWQSTDPQKKNSWYNMTYGNGVFVTASEYYLKGTVSTSYTYGLTELNQSLKNTATGSDSLTIGGIAATTAYSTNVGISSAAKDGATALGYNARAAANGSIQIGNGENADVGTLKVALGASSSSLVNYELLKADGTVPAQRLLNTIIKGDSVPTTSTVADYVGQTYQTPFGQTYICKSINTVSLNGTITGSFEVYDGVVVGCDHSNTTIASINTGRTLGASSSWEVIQKVYVSAPNTRSGSSAIISPSGGGGDVYIDTANIMHVNSPGSTSSLAVMSDAWTWVKVYCDGSAQTKIDCLVDNGYTLETLPTTGWTTFNTVAKNIFGGYYLRLSPGNQGYFPTDHKCTQIKENGTVVFTGTTALETPQYIWRPVGDLYNKYNTAQSLSICGKIDNSGALATAVGFDSRANGTASIALGSSSNAGGSGAVAIGRSSVADSQEAIAVGYSALAISSKESIQIGKGYNPYSRTFRIGLPKLVGTSYPAGFDDETGCYELLNTEGLIPGERLTNTVLKGTTAPTALTQAQYVGQFYYDSVADKMYSCKAIDKTGDRQTAIVGTLTETNHDISGFSAANYMTMSSVLDPDNYDEGFEINFGFTLSTLGATQAIISPETPYKSGITILVSSSNRLVAYVSLNGTSWAFTLTCSTALVANKKYIGKFTYNKYNGYTLFVSYDTSYLQGKASNTTVTKPYYSSSYPTWWLGKDYGNNYVRGTLHLDDFFIKLDNSKVFVPYYKSTWKEIGSADSAIPAARLGTLPTSDGTYKLTLTITNGVPVLSFTSA